MSGENSIQGLWRINFRAKDSEGYYPMGSGSVVGLLRRDCDTVTLETLVGTLVARLREVQESPHRDGTTEIIGRADSADLAADRTPGGSRWEVGEELAWLCEPLSSSLAPASREEMEDVFHFRSGQEFLRDSARSTVREVPFEPEGGWSDTSGRTQRLAWLEATGELYLYRPGGTSSVHVLAVIPTEEEVLSLLAGWRSSPMTLGWLCERLSGHPGADALVRADAV